jgi:SAM-dependent methyltransferase
MIVSPITNKQNVRLIFEQKEVPVFQNKVYKKKDDAISCLKLPVKLYQCLDTGFVFSGDFNPDVLDYNEDYQNEQGNSAYFQNHLNQVYELIKSRNLLKGKIVEIGCGKGLFLDLLSEKGHSVIGVDPTYEGDSNHVIKEYYSEKHKELKADAIILRHTLEHIAKPYDFLHMISNSNNENTLIYIEIPTFEWIYKNNAIEDVFYEHCNYFTKKSIRSLFSSCEVHSIFNGQYMGIIARLGDLKDRKQILETEIEEYPDLFKDGFEKYLDLIQGDTQKMIWGAGAKGSTFLNLMDVNAENIQGVIDINPKKQNKYIGGTGHLISSPEILLSKNINEIIIVNPNYKNEIEDTISKLNLSITLKTL